uniref:Regulating synaptic membrane exocytosis 3 n=1 Tax=Junco hyemalis TaxID=40217 RepID=A0A8C5ISD0_JUNHY
MFNGDASSSSARNVVRSSSISGEMYSLEKSARGSADSVSVTVTASKKRRSSLGAKMVAIVGLSQWSKSTLQLNQTEGGPKKLRSTIRRSTETGIAVEMRTRVTRQGSRESTDGSTNSNSSDGTPPGTGMLHSMKILCRFIFPTTRLGAESQFSDFLDGLGPGQLVGRQTLATPPMGEQGRLRREGMGKKPRVYSKMPRVYSQAPSRSPQVWDILGLGTPFWRAGIPSWMFEFQSGAESTPGSPQGDTSRAALGFGGQTEEFLSGVSVFGVFLFVLFVFPSSILVPSDGIQFL